MAGVLTPLEFIALAEQTELIGAITEWVLREALTQCESWRRAGQDLRVAVNISARNMRDVRFPEVVAGLVRETGVDPGAVELEVTENTIGLDRATAQSVLARLRSSGLSISIDDFGTGLLVDGAAARSTRRPHQDRPEFCDQHGPPGQGRPHRPGHRPARSGSRHGDDRRGRRGHSAWPICCLGSAVTRGRDGSTARRWRPSYSPATSGCPDGRPNLGCLSPGCPPVVRASAFDRAQAGRPLWGVRGTSVWVIVIDALGPVTIWA